MITALLSLIKPLFCFLLFSTSLTSPPSFVTIFIFRSYFSYHLQPIYYRPFVVVFAWLLTIPSLLDRTPGWTLSITLLNILHSCVCVCLCNQNSNCHQLTRKSKQLVKWLVHFNYQSVHTGVSSDLIFQHTHPHIKRCKTSSFHLNFDQISK